jgi:hypothetical protein
MEITVFLYILTAASILCPFVIEAIKKLLSNKQYDVNILSVAVTAIISLAICVCYLVVANVTITPAIIVYIIGTVFFSVLGSLLGYDKMFSMLFKLIKKEKTEEE